ncbi:MAG: HD domain-containing protein, partial [Acetivibrio ethanolgignens]
KVVQAGGLYHEIGRIAGSEDIEEGVKLGGEFDLPQPVIDIIRQHNSKYEKPQSVEAAVVMITDSIVSTIEYMEKEQKGKNVQVSAAKIIEQIFDIRFKKGTLDESGMDIRNYKKLKEFFQNEYSKGAKA